MFYIIFLCAVFVCLAILFFLFYQIKRHVNVWFMLYLSVYISLSFYLSLNYVEDFFFLWSSWWEESFIVKDPNDWVLSLVLVSFWFTLIFFLPYWFFVVYNNLKSLFFMEEQLNLKIFNLLVLYVVFLSLILLAADFGVAGISSLAEVKVFSIEFQPEIENVISFLIGTYVDFFFTFLGVVFFLFFWLFYLDRVESGINNVIGLVFIGWIYYWFGGETWTQDFFVLLFFLLIFETLKILKYFVLFLHRHNKNY